MLNWYEIQSVLGQGAFGITYRAQDVNLGQSVAIKEYFPTDLSTRTQGSAVEPVSEEHRERYAWGLSRFIAEARTLGRFHHPSIVRVLSVFEENASAYMIMELVEGEGFDRAVKSRHVKGEEMLKPILLALLDGVEVVHAEGFIHRDIKPANISMKSDMSPVLIDFGSARQAIGQQTRALTALVSPGYAPYEQYGVSGKDDEKQGPWTDIYALGATFYRAVTGKGPIDAMARVRAYIDGKDILVPSSEIAAGHFSDRFLRGIDKALAFRPRDRPQSVAQWREMLVASAAPAAVAVSDTPVMVEPVRHEAVASRPSKDDDAPAPRAHAARAATAGARRDPAAGAGSRATPATPAEMHGAAPSGKSAGKHGEVRARREKRAAGSRKQAAPPPPPEAPARAAPTPPAPARRARAAARESTAVRRQRADSAGRPGVWQALATWLRTEGRVAMALGCASIALSIFLMMAQVVGMIMGLCILGGGAGLIGRTYRPELSIARGVCAWLGGAFAMFTFLGIGYSFVVSFFSLLFALGLFYASFAEDFLDL